MPARTASQLMDKNRRGRRQAVRTVITVPVTGDLFRSLLARRLPKQD